MSWSPPLLIVKVALALGPSDTPTEPDWTDLSDRVRGDARGRRGRSDARAAFSPGTVEVDLDNSDRMLDPLNPDGLVYAADGLGLPLCPVLIAWRWNGTDHTVFSGFLTGECWQTTTAPHGETSRVKLQAVDEIGCSTGLPVGYWEVFTQATAPDWWLKMDGGFPVLADGSEIPNRSGSGGSAVVYSPSGISRYVQSETGSQVSPTPSARIVADNTVTSPASLVMPDGDAMNLTTWVFFQAKSAVATGDTARIVSMTDPGGSTLRWEVWISDDGEAHAASYDAAGTLIAADVIDRTATGVSRWDDGTPRLVIVRFTSGNNMDVWVGGATLTGGTLTAAAAVYESDLVLGPSTVDAVYDDLVLWRRDLTDELIAGTVLAAASIVYPWHGDVWADRLGHWFDAAGKTVDVDVTDEWHMPVPDGDDGLFGIGQLTPSVPATLFQALDDTTGFAGGCTWVTREGRFRCRSVQALTDPFYAPHYSDTSAVFTDADSLGDGEYRHAGVVPSGTDIDTVINRVEVLFYRRQNPPSNVQPAAFVIRPGDDESIARYRLREEPFQTEWWGWIANSDVADAMLARYAHPAPGIHTVSLDALGDDDLTTWLAETCELELAVDVAYTPFGKDQIVAEGLNIQQITWTLGPDRLTADLTVARS